MNLKEELEAADKDLMVQKKYVLQRMSCIRSLPLCQYDKRTLELAKELIERI